MSNEPNAYELDQLWLFDHGHYDVDAEAFTGQVCRWMEYGTEEEDAREKVLGLMKQ
jgi:hypothetical protein